MGKYKLPDFWELVKYADDFVITSKAEKIFSTLMCDDKLCYNNYRSWVMNSV